jgi:hypothetical protein
MTFIRRFTEMPSDAELTSIEAINIIDRVAPNAPNGVQSGKVLVVGETEDGPFAAGGDAADSPYAAQSILDVLNDTDRAAKYGGFGFTYAGVPSQNPCARQRYSAWWNGNAFVRLRNLGFSALCFARVDSSVGSVNLSPLASIDSGVGPFSLNVADVLTFTTQAGGPASSTAIAATAGVSPGAAGVFPTLFTGGENINIAIDGGPTINVVFQAGDQTNAQVRDRINAVLGYTAASLNAGQVDIAGRIFGTSGRVVISQGTSGAATLTTLGQTAGTYAGTGNVGNTQAVTAAEIATIVNGTAGLTAIFVAARVLDTGALRFYTTTTVTGTINVTSTAMSTVLGLLTGTTVDVGDHAGGTIPAGTRVRNAGGLEWVTMQTLQIDAAETGPFAVKVRPANDIGTAPTAGIGTVTTLVDAPTFAQLSVTNPVALTAALTAAQLDARYQAALNATLAVSSPAASASFLLVSMIGSPALTGAAEQNVISASNNGLFGRKLITSEMLGATQATAQANALGFDEDRVYFTWPGLQTIIPEIALVGVEGGSGFTADGVIDVPAMGLLASICSLLPPEENPGQATRFSSAFFALDSLAPTLDITNYKALRAAGVCAPFLDTETGMEFQSGVTTSQAPGRKEIARRNMADFIQDSSAQLARKYSKKMNKTSNRDAFQGEIDAFLGNLQQVDRPEASRIAAWSTKYVETAAQRAQGIAILRMQVQLYSSLLAIVIDTEIGENVQVSEAA